MRKTTMRRQDLHEGQGDQNRAHNTGSSGGRSIRSRARSGFAPRRAVGRSASVVDLPQSGRRHGCKRGRCHRRQHHTFGCHGRHVKGAHRVGEGKERRRRRLQDKTGTVR